MFFLRMRKILGIMSMSRANHPAVHGDPTGGVPRSNVGESTFTIYLTVSCPAGERNHAFSGT